MFSLTQSIADHHVRVARQAERGVIRALRVGRPNAETACRLVTPLQKLTKRHRIDAEDKLHRIREKDG